MNHETISTESYRLGLRRLDSETWRNATKREAGALGLSEEVLEEFDRQVADGRSEAQAAFNALWDWDCLCFITDDK